MQLNLLSTNAKPVFKWAGGKGQLISQIDSYFPIELRMGKLSKYVEPFIGGGAVFFHIAKNFQVEEYIVADINPELIMAYRSIRKDVEQIIDLLNSIQNEYYSLDQEERKRYYYSVRSEFNHNIKEIDYSNFHPSWITRTAQIIYLNRTCFNGLFRVNSKGEFNVPFGSYKKPKISDPDNLRSVSQVLQNTKIFYTDFTEIEPYVGPNTFVYFDPPYRPISDTASFTSYSKDSFNDSEQLRLAQFYRKLDGLGAKLMLSNSDPKNVNTEDSFFEDAYSGYKIEKVRATRNINSVAASRGKINELLIMNY